MGRAGPPPATPSPWPPQYVAREAVGTGLLGQLFRALDERRGVLVAVKELKRSKCELHGLPFPPCEAEVAGSLSHPHLVKTFTVVNKPDAVYMIQEVLLGGTLAVCMEQSDRFSEFMARCCFKDLLSGVEYLHACRITHRDLNPDNVALTALGRLKIMDFAHATRFGPGQRFTEVVGRPSHTAPEVARRQPYEGPPVDVWALGVMLFSMVCGRLPFGPQPVSHQLPALPDETSMELARLLPTLLSIDPSERASLSSIVESDWMTLAVRLSPGSSEMELASSTSPSSTFSPSSFSSLTSDSPLDVRAGLEREKVEATRRNLRDDLS